MRLKIDKMEYFHYRNNCQIGHFFMNFYYARYQKVKKSVPPNIKNEASDHLKEFIAICPINKYFLNQMIFFYF